MPDQNNIPEPFESGIVQYIAATLEMPCFPGKVPQRAVNVYPRLTYGIVSGLSDLVLSGPSGLAYKTIQIDCWALSDLDACTLREQLRYALMGYRGLMGSWFVSNTVVSELPGPWEAGVDAQDSGTYRRTVEAKFTYYEYVPVFPSVIPLPDPSPIVSVQSKNMSILDILALSPPFGL